jgi:hypothetical protein
MISTIDDSNETDTTIAGYGIEYARTEIVYS